MKRHDPDHGHYGSILGCEFHDPGPNYGLMVDKLISRPRPRGSWLSDLAWRAIGLVGLAGICAGVVWLVWR